MSENSAFPDDTNENENEDQPKVHIHTMNSPEEAEAFFSRLFGGGQEAQREPTLSDLEDAQVNAQALLDTVVPTVGHLRTLLIAQNFSEMAAEQIAGAYFLGMMK